MITDKQQIDFVLLIANIIKEKDIALVRKTVPDEKNMDPKRKDNGLIVAKTITNKKIFPADLWSDIFRKPGIDVKCLYFEHEGLHTITWTDERDGEQFLKWEIMEVR